jgi:hypothetical protein
VAEGDQATGLISQYFESSELLSGQLPRQVVHYTERAYCKTIRRNERSTSIEADLTISRHKRVTRESGIVQSIRDRENVMPAQRVSAKSEIVLDFVER